MRIISRGSVIAIVLLLGTHMNRSVLLIPLSIVLAIGCRGSESHQGSVATVPATDVTRTMVGQWGNDGEISLIITLSGDRVIIGAPKNDTWRMDIMDATIAGDTIQFVQKNYLHGAEFHPFNGVACNSVAKLVDIDRLELTVTSINTPELKPGILVRIK